jgi:type IV pilus assembly protein PilM
LNSFLLSAAPPTIAVEIARYRVSAATVSGRDAELTVNAHASEPLAPGVVMPSLNAANITDPRTVEDALRRVLDKLGSRPKRIALAIPDSVAKVSLLRFEKVPERSQDLEELLRWQVRKTAPFRVDDAQLSFVPGLRGADGSCEFVVVMARRDLVREYEAVCESVGAQAGVVDLTTFNVINSVLAGVQSPSGDWLLVHVAEEDATMAILRGSQLVFFRNHELDGEASLADMVHQTAMYYEDRLSGAGFARVILAGGPASAGSGRGADYLRQALEQRLGTKVDSIDDARAALVGLIARERAA